MASQPLGGGAGGGSKGSPPAQTEPSCARCPPEAPSLRTPGLGSHLRPPSLPIFPIESLSGSPPRLPLHVALSAFLLVLTRQCSRFLLFSLHPSSLCLLRPQCKINFLITSLHCSEVVSKIKQKLKQINGGGGGGSYQIKAKLLSLEVMAPFQIPAVCPNSS